jgi:serine/threonine-protein kinase
MRAVGQDRDAEESLVGSLFAGRFHVDALLGVGGMGAVYLARHDVLQRQVALKVIRTELLADLQALGRFRREARAASRVVHPHVAQIHDFGYSEEGVPYLVMEYVEGPALADLLCRSGRLPLKRALDVLLQIAEALAAAHGAEVIHRDLKPENIVLATGQARPDHVKILDFGLAKILDSDGSSGLSTQGILFGTPEYMSPEQAQGGVLDHRTDLYSLGIVGFEMVTGTVPFAGGALEVIRGHAQRMPPAPSAISGRGELAPAFDALILRCLAKRPDERPASAAALAEEIRGLQLGL